ncbi:hypothetical protein HME9302_00405 [Alteripontixanthobacter maritimus]|uniref:Uncharacterized protein n=1 Tax=Alteripontixanthobacter maritimus TaxID=2161824 RepID=A0A369Q443_9SPHN|nr:hypothetical protein [Alteripontixanthobacter maritimus]RDC59220.1 hypothetical protein HME9302_00405 [Alteripontixanthobacter maritimus]
MIGRLIGAFVGSKAAKQTSAIGGSTGAVLGVLAPTILRRMSIPGMLAIGAGGYLVKKLADKKDQPVPADKNASTLSTV